MDSDLYYDSFLFCSRDDLERLQPLSQSLLHKINAGSKVLPLRPIARVEMEDLAEENLSTAGYDPDPDYEASILDGDFKKTFLRLQHTCVKFFSVKICDSPFLRYWKAEESAAFTVVSIKCERTYDMSAVDWDAYYDGAITLDPPDTTDYDVFDSIVNHLRPKATHVDGHDKELVARDSFLNTLQTCGLYVGKNAFPPPTFFLNEPGYQNYDIRCGLGQVADAVDDFIESFIRDGCTNGKLQSVCIKCRDLDDQQTLAPKKLSGEPMKTDVPPPKIDTNMVIFSEDDRVSQCDVHSFFNTEQRKQMDVYKWSVDRGADWFPRTIHILLCRVEAV